MTRVPLEMFLNRTGRRDHEQDSCVARCKCPGGRCDMDCPCSDRDGQMSFDEEGRCLRRREYPLDCCGARCSCAGQIDEVGGIDTANDGALAKRWCRNRLKMVLPRLVVTRERK
eukprot:SAG31_NODE_101_length_25195_cov_67.436758_13_plen_114_part_00